ncbi:hypothetical protein LNTAR_16598 [Lentisphaera araneosa HTCC2155]|uniref:3-keto-alpha-glucoside-1,2-lyase/3-keto-2-hydroxy-glucal hydratase domain-containing protein n=1 Tax=Lentisphaera araneosa HTCC2155 TaxID=313628 RepID=A6DQD4_9BACT|nr:DUF1080 domain-containing protein [Lentisphaera araneosa]EDM26185.1 hypothetical protein LNTAR_16598 [Lentisphaera araneosa HTCC2155]
MKNLIKTKLLCTLTVIFFNICAHSQVANGVDSPASTPQLGLLTKWDLSAWQNIYPHGEAKLFGEEIRLMSSGKNWFYLTKKTYKNFILELEVKMPDVKELSNSGVIFRAQIKKDESGSVAVGYQAEVDTSSRKWSGGLYDQGRRAWLHPKHKKRSNPDSDFKNNYSPEWTAERSSAYKHLEWNKYRIECRGSDIKIFVNDILTTHVMDVKDSEGYIGLQHHGSELFRSSGDRSNTVRFRKLKLRELE